MRFHPYGWAEGPWELKMPDWGDRRRKLVLWPGFNNYRTDDLSFTSPDTVNVWLFSAATLIGQRSP